VSLKRVVAVLVFAGLAWAFRYELVYAGYLALKPTGMFDNRGPKPVIGARP
jgi:hypothetical protein